MKKRLVPSSHDQSQSMITNFLHKIIDEFFFNETYQKLMSLAQYHHNNSVQEISHQIDLIDVLIINIQKHIGYGNLKQALRLVLVLDETVKKVRKQLDEVELLGKIL